MASNLTVLSQYVTSLHRMLMEVMQSVFGRFPSRAIDEAAPVPRVHRASTQMAAMGIWHPPISPRKAVVSMYINEFRWCQKLILFS